MGDCPIQKKQGGSKDSMAQTPPNKRDPYIFALFILLFFQYHSPVCFHLFVFSYCWCKFVVNVFLSLFSLSCVAGVVFFCAPVPSGLPVVFAPFMYYHAPLRGRHLASTGHCTCYSVHLSRALHVQLLHMFARYLGQSTLY